MRSIIRKFHAHCFRSLFVVEAAVVVLFSNPTQAQVRYSFSSSTAPYNPFVGSSVFTWNTLKANDDEYSAPVNIGFNFSYNGTTYTQLQVSTNGFLRFGSDLTSSLPIDNLTGTVRNIVAPFWFDFKIDSTTSHITYQVIGSPGSRVFAVEWKNLTWDTTGVPYAAFQVRLREASGVMEFVYGGSNAPNSGQPASGSIGLVDGTPITAVGQGTGRFLSVNLGGYPGARVFHRSRGHQFQELTALPDSSTVLTFTPVIPSPLLPGTYTVGGTSPHFASLSDAADALSLNGIAGPITVAIRSGTYDDVLHLVAVSGTSPANTITIQRQSGLVTISPRNGSSIASTTSPTAGDPIVRLDGTSYVTIDGLSIEENTSNTTSVTKYEAGVMLATAVVSTSSGTIITGSRFNTIRNVSIDMKAVVGSVADPGSVGIRFTTPTNVASSDTSTANSYNTIQDVTIRGFFRSAIHMSGFSATNPDRGNKITAATGRNDIGNISYTTGGAGNDIRALEFTAQNNLVIEKTDVHDIVTNQFSTNSIYGIILNPGGGTADAVGGTVLIQNVNVFNLRSEGPAVTTGSVKGLECDRTADGTTLTVRNCGFSGLFNNTYNAFSFFNLTGLAEAIRVDMAPFSGTTTLEFYNNMIFDIRAPRSEDPASAPSIRGLALQSTTNSVVNAKVYYNTILLNDTIGVIPRVSSACIYWNSFTYSSLDLRNNILVNNTYAAGTGIATCLWTTDLATLRRLASTTDNNLYYTGVPASSRPISYDGSTAYQTLAAHRAIVQSGGLGGPRDAASVTENPPFLSSAQPYNLHINPTIGTQIERGALPISGITTDLDGAIRNTYHPDIGAYEGDYTLLDLAGPRINYTPLSNTTSSQNRTLSNVSITALNDVDVVDFKPRLYFKRASDNNVFGGNTSADNGWKWTETAQTSNPFSFVFNFSLLYNGPPVTGDVIQYFVVAQDQAGAPQVRANPSDGFSAVSIAQVTTAPTSPSTFTIAYSISGLMSVGTNGDVPTLTGSTGLFSILNAGVLVGNIVVDITSSLSEDGAVALNQLVEEGVGGYTVTVRSSEPAERLISGSAAGGLIRLNGADRVVFDGRVSGSGKYLRFRNTNAAGSTIVFVNDASSNTLTNCVIEGAANTATSGVVFFGAGIASGNNNNTVSNCDIRDRSDATAKPVNGIYSFATASPSLFNRGNSILNNNIYNYHFDGGVSSGIRLDDGNTTWTISGNSIYQEGPRTFGSASTRYGIFVNYLPGEGFVITNNYIGGRAPLAGGARDSIIGQAAVLYYPIRVAAGTGNPSSVQGNIVANISLQTTLQAQLPLVFSGIYVSGGVVNVGNLSGNTIGSDNSTGSILLTVDGTGNNYSIECISFRGSSGIVQNNKIGSISISGASDRAGSFAGIAVSNLVSSSVTISGNTVGSSSVANSITQTTATNPRIVFSGISNSSSGTTLVTSNTVKNLSSVGTAAISAIRGIAHDGTADMTVSLNSIGSLTSANTNSSTTGNSAVAGILCIPSSGVSVTISGNTISGLTASSTSTATKITDGISIQNTRTAIVSKNRIFDLRNLSAGTNASVAAGIHVYTILNNTEISNNTVSLGAGQNTNIQFVGIWNNNSTVGALSLYHNSVVISDTAKSGANPTYAFYRGLNTGSTDVTTQITARNNAWINRRVNLSPATGIHYAIGNRASTNPASGWASDASNFNALYSAKDSSLALWGTTSRLFAGFQTISGGESNSVTENPPFVSVAGGDLHVVSTSPTNLEGGGTPLSGLTTDFEGDARNTQTPDIGADEFNGTPSIKALTLTVLLEGLTFGGVSSSPAPIDEMLRRVQSLEMKNNDGSALQRKIAYLDAVQKRNINLSLLKALGGLTIRDTIRVILRSGVSPYGAIDTAKAFSGDSGRVILSFTKALNNVPYYLVVKHRNSLETWSALPQTILNGVVSYDFTTAASRALGNNLKLRGSKYCVYAGDINQDGIVDISDLVLVDNAVTNFLSGYVGSDVNGDGVVDGSDVAIIDNNSHQYVVVIRPAGAQ